MGEMIRLYPEAKTALIKWIEDHFHDIESFVTVLHLKDRTTWTIYDIPSYLTGLGLLELAKDSLQTAFHEGELILQDDGQ